MTGPGTRWLTSRRNAAGMLGALLGPLLALAGILGDGWPLVSALAYAVLACAVRNPRPPAPPESLLTTLRREAAGLHTGLDEDPRGLPTDAAAAVRRILDVLAPVLDRMEDDPVGPADAAALATRLDTASAVLREDLPHCLELFAARPPSTPYRVATGELARQLELIGGAVDRLAAEVPDAGALRAAALTAELRHRYPPP